MHSKEFKVSTIRMMERKGMNTKEPEESLRNQRIPFANGVAKLTYKGQNHPVARPLTRVITLTPAM